MASLSPSWQSYAKRPHWRRIHGVLPERLRIPEPWDVREEWLSVHPFQVHLDRWPAKAQKACLIIVHGVGGHGRLLAPYGRMCQLLGYEAVAPDMPGYGLTSFPSKFAITYEDWRKALSAVIVNEAEKGLPVFVFGLSMGGMLAYDATARTRLPKGLIATCLPEPTDPAVRRNSARWPWLGPAIEPLLTTVPMMTDRLPIPMRLAVNMREVANDPSLADAIMADPLAGGNWVAGRFLRTLLAAKREVEPEAFDVCPVLLAHPADDRWTDVAVSRSFFDRLRLVPTKLEMLENGGHFPVEEPAHEKLRAAIQEFVGGGSNAKGLGAGARLHG